MSDIALPPRSNRPAGSDLPENMLDHIFQALANRTRRSLINMLKNGPAKVTDLAKPFGMSLNAVSKHLIVLERAGLITRNIEGRAHYCTLQAGPLATAEQWLASYEIFWTTNLDSLAQHVEALEPNKD